MVYEYKISQTIEADKRIEITVDSIKETDSILPKGKIMIIEGVEARILTAGQRYSLSLDGEEKADYTVPEGRILLIFETLVDTPEKTVAPKK